MSKHIMPGTAGPVPARALPPRGASSFTPQAPIVPFPHPEHHGTPLKTHPRPFGHGRSGSSASIAPLIVVAPDPKTVAKMALLDQGLPTLPSPGGLGLFSQSYEEPASAIPIGFPRRPTGTRRATISEVRLTTAGPSPEEENLIAREHQRQDAMWEKEQAARKRELEEERVKYEEEMAKSFTQQPLKSRKRSPSIRPPAKSDSPLLNEFGLPSPPATSSTPPSNAMKPPISTREERARWKNEIRNVIGRQQEEERDAYEKAAHAEQQKLWRDNARRDRARKEAEAAKAAAEHAAAFVPREMPYSDYSRTQVKVIAAKRDVEGKRQMRARRKPGSQSGYISSERRSSDGFGRSSANSHYRFTRAKRYYGEGTTDLREEGLDEPILNHSDGWEDIDTNKLKNEQEARLAVAAWNLYESRWGQLVNTPPDENSLRFVDIPWPSLESLPSTESPRSPTSKRRNLIPSALQIASVLNPKSVGDFLLSPHHSKDKNRRLRLRAALLRFHPDKVSRWLNLIQESERGAVVMGVEIVVRCLNELMDKPSS